jgi:tetratricopeptide (TPR) repeat protein
VSIQNKRRSFVLTERFRRSERVDVDPAVVDRVRALYDAGRYLDAFEASRAAGPLQAWQGSAALEIGSRLAGNLGGDRVARLLLIRAHRAHPHDPGIAVHYGHHLCQQGGPMAAWNHALRFERHERVPETHLAELLGMRARIAAEYRDFETAQALLGRAFTLAPGYHWLLVEKAAVLLSQERREEALGALDESLQAAPWFRPAVQLKARLLHVLGRLDAAVDLLTRASLVLQSAAVVAQLLGLKRESDDDEGMLELLDRLEVLAPLSSAMEREWMAARRADALYLAGDFAAASVWAERVHHPDYERLARRLRTMQVAGKRIRLPFRFIPQGHRTCGPATLAAIAQHWDTPVTQAEIVEAIAYDGTYDYTERAWCETHGFAAREFKVTWDAARILLDQGVPFALATVDANLGHLQAVVGYDTVRETLFIQDPSEPHYREVPAEEFIKRYQLTGPRGMAVVPAARRSWLQALALPEADLFDLNHVLQTALGAHRRGDAVAALESLEAREPEGRLALLGRLALTGFDGDAVERLRVLDRLLNLFPDDQRLLAWRLQLMREIGRSEDRLALLRRAVRLEHAHPLFTKELAIELAVDIRNQVEVGRLLWKAHRMAPPDPTVLTALAAWRLGKGRDEVVLDLERFAAAIAEKDESLARHWFNAASAHGRTQEALAWLQRRFVAHGGRSAGPGITFAQCLDLLNRTDEALKVMREAIERRPEDAGLLVEAARLHLSSGQLAEAERLLGSARGRCSPRLWHRRAAALEQRRGDRPQALKAWKQVLEHEPLALDVHQAVFEQLGCLEGEEAAFRYLEEVCTRFPHHYGLNELHTRKLQSYDVEAAVASARGLVENHPWDPRARRILATLLEQTHRLEEAHAFARSACEIEPDAASHTILGKILGAQGRTDDARRELREAIRKNVNHLWAWENLIELTHSSAERREVLDLVRAQMSSQVLQGAAVEVYRRFARQIYDPGDLVAHLRELWHLRPDLWESWSALISQQLDLGNKEEAERLAGDAIARFPLLAGAWRDLSTVQSILGNEEEALRAIRRALDLNPDWSGAWLDLSKLLEQGGRPAEAIDSLRTAIRRLPLAADLRLRLAEMLWRADSRDEAWQLAATAAEADPTAGGVWDHLRRWASILRREEDLASLARNIARDRPGEARSWLVLARVLPTQAVDERLAAYDRAIQTNPRMGEAYDLKAVSLARLGRLDAAEAVLRQEPWGAQAPAFLRGRLAWLKAIRGQFLDAMREMSAVLEQNQDYRWGWERLAEWAQRTNDVPTLRRAASELMRLAPRHPDGYCFAAAADGREGKADEAAALLVRALELEPGHEYAARTLLAHHWQRQDAGALETLPSLLLQGGEAGWVGRAAGVLAAAIRNDEPQLRGRLAPLVRAPDPMEELVGVVQHAFSREAVRLRPVLDSVLDDCVRSNRIGPSFATLWVRFQAIGGHWECWEAFQGWRARMGALARPAIAEYVDQAAGSVEGMNALARLIQAQRSMLQEDTLLWGKIGHAFARSARYREAASWLAGAERRPDVKGWILVTLMVSLRQLGMEAEATEVSTLAVRGGLHDGSWNIHLAQAAFGAARRKDLTAAREILALPTSGPTTGEWAMVREMSEMLVRVLSQPPDRAAAGLSSELGALKALAARHPRTAPLVRAYVETMEQLGRHAGRWVGFWRKRYPAGAVRVTPSRPVTRSWPLIWLGPLFVVLANLARMCPTEPSPQPYVSPAPSSPQLIDPNTGETRPRMYVPPAPPRLQLTDPSTREPRPEVPPAPPRPQLTKPSTPEPL